MKKLKHKFRVGDWVKIIKLPTDLTDSSELKTAKVFKAAKGKAFRIEGFGRYGHLELEVTKLDTIWIEPEFVVLVDKPLKKK